MNAATVSALAALAGSVIGGLTSFLTSWLIQRAQAKEKRRERETRTRMEIYGQFIEEASKLYAAAIERNDVQISDMIALYTLTNRMRLISSAKTIANAEKVLEFIGETFLAPNKTFQDLRDSGPASFADPLREFGLVSREELDLINGARM
ncbi:hypothetical protein [Methylovirgula sp. 4M-Z18]|uniref:hypothetical protein n=1 Tax=Methylovirgula sp. 4M-Z18 TaxID=2293567 RepID=UPI000E2FC214|nr:hypothetical protein [Methylovirgula sp. 4M-Z18]RFB78717.1 hypothetical protein DYH55_16110 [Methylovirgula sp. 4M-Z18]